MYRDHRDEPWTSRFTFVEPLLVAYREDRNAERVVTNAVELVDVRGDTDAIVAAATHVEDHGFTTFDAIHLVESEGDTIVTGDGTYDGFPPRFDLEEASGE